MNKKKLVLLLTTLASTATLLAANVFLYDKSSITVGNMDNIQEATLTFDEAHRSVTTEHGNTITTSVAGSMKYVSNYLCGISGTNSNGYFYITKPFQSISKIQVTWRARCTFEMMFKIGTTNGGSDVYNTGNIVGLMKDYTERTTTYNITNSGSANYFSIYASGCDSTTYFYFKQVVITYSCSYN